MNERARAQVCACVVKPFGSREEERAGKRRRARSYTYIYIYIYIMYNNIRENLTANPTALDVIEYRGGPASDLTHALIYIYTYS